MTTLRSYQKDARKKVLRSIKKGKKPLVQVATGGGKTTIICSLIEPRNKKKILVIGHTQEIVTQLYEALKNKTNVGLVFGKKHEIDEKIVVSSRQTIYRRLKRLDKSTVFDRMIIDEAHHAEKENTYGKIFQKLKELNPNVSLVGLTATPEKKNYTLFDELVYKWSVKTGTDSGYLVKLKRVNYNTTKMDEIIKIYMNYCAKPKRQCLIFFSTIKKSQEFIKKLGQKGIKGIHIDGCTGKRERKKAVEDYKKGIIKVISNMQVLTEGFDAPETRAIMIARRIRSKTFMTQIIGRGLRPSPGKKECYLINVESTNKSEKMVDTIMNE